MKKVFIDGKAGTTGLRIYERLEGREDISLITLPEEERKNPESRKKALNEADVVFLCLPDDASREAVSMIEKSETVIIDTSTAHRTEDGWAYGFPELYDNFEEEARKLKKVAVPGCHASGFIALVKPLVDGGIIENTARLTCHSVTGYSGGGKKMIGQYETEESPLLKAPRQYGLTQMHKHLKEMKAKTGLVKEPVFCPIVSNFYSGMMVTVPLFKEDIKDGKTILDIKNIYKEKYNSEIVKYEDCADESMMLSAASLSGKDNMKVYVYGNDERILLTALYDNLGKGASGAAIEVLNIYLGCDKTEGLEM